MEEEADFLEDGEIDEPCEISSTADQFLVSRQTREPQTICSDESSNEKSEDSDEDSDAQCSRPKRVKPQLAAGRSQVPNKYKVWSIALQEEALMENLHKCDVDAIDRERSVESYNYKIVHKISNTDYIDDQMPEYEHPRSEDDYEKRNDKMDVKVGGKRRRGDIKKRLGTKKRDYDTCPLRLPNLTVTNEDCIEDVAIDIATKLNESKQDLILNIVIVLGKQKAIDLYNETKELEENGGMLLMNGERRRTSGGIYLLLLKRDNSITAEAMQSIFSDCVLKDKLLRKKAKRRRSKRRIKEIKENLLREKLLSLNTAVGMPGPDPANHLPDERVESENCNLEEGEVVPELTVTNPPPSPATDQDTPPSLTQAYSDDETEEVKIARPENAQRVVNYEGSDEDYLAVDLDPDDMDVF